MSTIAKSDLGFRVCVCVCWGRAPRLVRGGFEATLFLRPPRPDRRVLKIVHAFSWRGPASDREIAWGLGPMRCPTPCPIAECKNRPCFLVARDGKRSGSCAGLRPRAMSHSIPDRRVPNSPMLSRGPGRRVVEEMRGAKAPCDAPLHVRSSSALIPHASLRPGPASDRGNAWALSPVQIQDRPGARAARKHWAIWATGDRVWSGQSHGATAP